MPSLKSGYKTNAICDRCKLTYKWSALSPDPNSPGTRVCKDCRDIFNPYRLAPRTDSIGLTWARPYPQLIAPPQDWYPPGLVAQPQPIPGVTATKNYEAPPPPQEPKQELTPAQAVQDYVPQRLKMRVKNTDGDRNLSN